MDKQLRLTAGIVVIESKLSKGAKLQLLAFIQHEATDIQIKALLLDGKILTKIDEQTKAIINDRFEVSEAGGRVAKLRKTTMSRIGTGSVGGAPAMAVAGILFGSYRKIRSAFDGCTKKCGTFELNTARRQHCMIKCKVAKLQGELAAATKAKNQNQINKKKSQLQKAQFTLKKSSQSFAQRGADE